MHDVQVQEAFVKIREQARAHLDRPNELVAGLNLLATTNLDYFGVSIHSVLVLLPVWHLSHCMLAANSLCPVILLLPCSPSIRRRSTASRVSSLAPCQSGILPTTASP